MKKRGLDGFITGTKVAKVSGQYKVRAIPSTFLIDGEGVIRKTNLRGHALEHAVEDLVKENLARPPDPPANTREDSSRSESIPATKLIKQEKTPQKAEARNPFKPWSAELGWHTCTGFSGN